MTEAGKHRQDHAFFLDAERLERGSNSTDFTIPPKPTFSHRAYKSKSLVGSHVYTGFHPDAGKGIYIEFLERYRL